MSSLITLTSVLLITLLISSFTYEDPYDDIGLTGYPRIIPPCKGELMSDLNSICSLDSLWREIMRLSGPWVRTRTPLFCLPLGTQALGFGVGRRTCDMMECVSQKDHSDGMTVGPAGNPLLPLVRYSLPGSG